VPASTPLGRVPVLLLLAAATGFAPGAEAPPAAPRCWPSAADTDPARCPPNDPDWPKAWEFRGDVPPEVDATRMHPAERALGAIGSSLDRAWQRTIGRDDVVVAVLDSGIRWNDPELRLKVRLNAGELPVPAGADVHDADGNGRFDVDDYARLDVHEVVSRVRVERRAAGRRGPARGRIGHRDVLRRRTDGLCFIERREILPHCA